MRALWLRVLLLKGGAGAPSAVRACARGQMVLEIYGPALRALLEPETYAYVTGTGDYGLVSDLLGCCVTWGVLWVGAVGFYHTCTPLATGYARRYYPHADTNKVSEKMHAMMVKNSHVAFPLYVTVAMLGELFRKKGWSRCCYSLEECGGWSGAILSSVLYFFFVELCIFVDHYYLLHKVCRQNGAPSCCVRARTGARCPPPMRRAAPNPSPTPRPPPTPYPPPSSSGASG